MGVCACVSLSVVIAAPLTRFGLTMGRMHCDSEPLKIGTVDSRSNEIASNEFPLVKNKSSSPFIVNSLYFPFGSKEILLLKNKFLCPLELVTMEIHCT